MPCLIVEKIAAEPGGWMPRLSRRRQIPLHTSSTHPFANDCFIRRDGARLTHAPAPGFSLASRVPHNAREPAHTLPAHVEVAVDRLEFVGVQAAERVNSAISHADRCCSSMITSSVYRDEILSR